MATNDSIPQHALTDALLRRSRSSDVQHVEIVKTKRTGEEMFAYFAEQTIEGFLETWFVMLSLGTLHIHVSQKIPAFGYWTTYLLLMGLTAVGRSLTRRSLYESIRELKR